MYMYGYIYIHIWKLSNADIGVLTAEADIDDGVYMYIYI
jgi:hypothetical protein